MYYKPWKKVFSSFKKKPFTKEKKIQASEKKEKKTQIWSLLGILSSLLALSQNLENEFTFTCLSLLITLVFSQDSPKMP